MSAITADHVLDTQGLSCPMPMLKTKKTMKNVASGQILEVIGTDPGSKNDIPDWIKKSGHELVGSTDEGGVFRFFIKKG
ncbi:MAG: sulfurtransferase TusA family protein [Proteobacteria bacterium]|nr:sulfurtransferase TusA family protein [Pseudomonadota bacterium]MBU1709640.1 sulfurtransferase TusA family protein [Pseudomonadota bacterium]